MTKFPTLEAMIAEVEHAELMFDMKTSKTYDDKVVAAAAAAYNQVLEKAAHAIVKDLGETDAKKFLEEWKPKYAVDTWFGPGPGDFIRHVLKSGSIHHGLLPDQTALR